MYEATYPDGTMTRIERSGDPRFHMESPLDTLVSMSYPSGQNSTISRQRQVTLDDPEDLLSVNFWQESEVRNGRTYTQEYDATTRTWTTRSPEGRETKTILGPSGEMLSAQVGTLAPLEMSYDLRGRLVLSTTQLGQDIRSTSMSYNAQGEVSSQTDSLGREMSFEYDANHRLTKQVLPDLREIQMSYDLDGNLQSVTPPSRPAHWFEDNHLGQIVQMTPPATPLISMPQTVYDYNEDHQLVLVTRPDGQTIELHYDATNGRLLNLQLPSRALTLTYDASSGQLAEIVDDQGTELNYVFDGNRLLSETLQGPLSGELTQDFDADGRLVEQRVNGSHAVVMSYDEDGLLTTLGELSLQYDATNGLLVQEQLRQVTTDRSYNGFGESTAVHTQVATVFDAEIQITRDGLGRIKSKEESFYGIRKMHCYVYDDAGRLTDVYDELQGSDCAGNRIESYAYDGNSNRIEAFNSVGSISSPDVDIDDQDRLLRYGHREYSYTANGELTRILDTTTLDETSLEYDVAGNLLGVDLPNGDRLDYIIDGRDRRVGKLRHGVAEQGFLYGDQLNIIAELDSNGQVLSRFVYAYGRHVPAYMERQGMVRRYMVDPLGSMLAVVDADTGKWYSDSSTTVGGGC